jgi:hypothetical protein
MAHSHSDPSKDLAVAQVTGHPARVGCLKLLGEHPSLTAQEAMDDLEGAPATLSGCNYHLWVLCRYGYLEPSGDMTDGGLPYRLTSRGRLLVEALSEKGGRA